MKKIICILMTIILVLPLAACGGSKGDDDPNLGVYEARTGEMLGIEVPVSDFYEEGFTIELKKKGKGKVFCDGEDAGIKWTLDGEDIHIEGGGLDLDGTLKDGVMVFDNIMDSGLKLTFICDDIADNAGSGSGDEDSSDEADADNDEGSLKDDIFGSSKSSEDSDDSGSKGLSRGLDSLDTSSDAGTWELYTVLQDGHTYMQEQLAAKGIESTITMESDGTGVIELAGVKSDMEWGDGKIKVTSGEDKGLEYTYNVANEFMVINDSGVILTFIKDDAAGSSGTASSASADISEDLIKKYEGDWHGLMMFTDGTGKWKERDGKKCDVVGRFSMDEDGNVTPFLAAAMKDDPDKYNFRDLEAFLDPRFNEMYISGKFLDGGELREEPATVENGLFHMKFTLVDEDSEITIEMAMRRLDEKWTDADYPRYSDEGTEFYKGYSLEEVLATFGNPPSGVPKQTHVTDWE